MTFKPGVSGNPGGRPKKGASIAGALREAMAEVLTIPQSDGTMKTVTKAEFLSFKLFQLAATGDLPALKLCLEHVDGPPRQSVALTNEEGGPVQIDVSQMDAGLRERLDALKGR